MHQTCSAPDTWLCVSRAAAAAAVRKAEAVRHHHPAPVNGLGQMITTAAVAALAFAPLKLSAHAQTHASAFNSPRQRCAKAQSIRGQGGWVGSVGGEGVGGAGGTSRHIYLSSLSYLFFFLFRDLLFMNLSVCVLAAYRV